MQLPSRNSVRMVTPIPFEILCPHYQIKYGSEKRNRLAPNPDRD